jgi:hypothetical protein
MCIFLTKYLTMPWLLNKMPKLTDFTEIQLNYACHPYYVNYKDHGHGNEVTMVPHLIAQTMVQSDPWAFEALDKASCPGSLRQGQEVSNTRSQQHVWSPLLLMFMVATLPPSTRSLWWQKTDLSPFKG